jgi:hypothetical protein
MQSQNVRPQPTVTRPADWRWVPVEAMTPGMPITLNGTAMKVDRVIPTGNRYGQVAVDFRGVSDHDHLVVAVYTPGDPITGGQFVRADS